MNRKRYDEATTINSRCTTDVPQWVYKKEKSNPKFTPLNQIKHIRTRIAPTPSGFLHYGNLFNFILTHLIARVSDGHLLLRIDDADGLRVKEPYIQDIFDTLRWLQITWDEGPKDSSMLYTTYSQLRRQALYGQWISKLAQTGLLFACNCSRSELMIHPSHNRCTHQTNVNDFPHFAWRLNTEHAGICMVDDILLGAIEVDVHLETPYPIIKKKDGFAAYTICSLADDSYFKINTIVRGQDLLKQTALQLHIAGLVNSELFLSTRFFHHPLVCNSSGQKLSKSSGEHKASLLTKSASPHEVFHAFACWVGLAEKPYSMEELLSAFTKRDIHTDPIRFSEDVNF